MKEYQKIAHFLFEQGFRLNHHRSSSDAPNTHFSAVYSAPFTDPTLGTIDFVIDCWVEIDAGGLSSLYFNLHMHPGDSGVDLFQNVEITSLFDMQSLLLRQMDVQRHLGTLCKACRKAVVYA